MEYPNVDINIRDHIRDHIRCHVRYLDDILEFLKRHHLLPGSGTKCFLAKQQPISVTI